MYDRIGNGLRMITGCVLFERLSVKPKKHGWDGLISMEGYGE
jgi:hypothetical protein